jgi:hypothetical protein
MRDGQEVGAKASTCGTPRDSEELATSVRNLSDRVSIRHLMSTDVSAHPDHVTVM